MAEGGDGNEENPFSFQKFVKKRSSPGSASSGDAEDEDDPFEIPDLRPDSSERNRARGLVVTDGMCSCHKQPRTVISMQSCQVTLDISGSPIDPSVALTEIAGVSLTEEPEKPKKKEENPFSFKKFLRSGGARPKTSPSPYVGNLQNGHSGRPGDLSTLDLANDLPDFVQDHFVGPSARSRPVSDVPLPDFTLDSGGHQAHYVPSPPLVPSPPDSPLHNGIDHFPEVPMGALPNPANGCRQRGGAADNIGLENDLLSGQRHSSEGSPVDDDGPHIRVPSTNSTGGLPDFISDSTVSGRGNLDSSHAYSDDALYQANGDAELELRRLREENRELRQQLEEARQSSESESQRVAKLLRDMEVLQKKEAEETSALENMVLQVEANLVATTERAVKAENIVTKLRQELKALQLQRKQSGSPRRGSPGGQSSQGSNDIMREKAKYASEQVAAAAQSAEAKLKELMSGVETLRLVSQVLASIDKVADESDDASPGEAKSPPKSPDEGATGDGDNT